MFEYGKTLRDYQHLAVIIITNYTLLITNYI